MAFVCLSAELCCAVEVGDAVAARGGKRLPPGSSMKLADEFFVRLRRNESFDSIL
jgi:hypothetical protein